MKTYTAKQIEKAFITWTKDSRESPDSFEIIDPRKMSDDHIFDYSKACAEFLIHLMDHEDNRSRKENRTEA